METTRAFPSSPGDRRVLVVVTSHGALGETGRATGYWLGEVTHFCAELLAREIPFDIASPLGGAAPMDGRSRSPRDPANRAFMANPTVRSKLEATLRLADVEPGRYAAIYLAGGHGTMWDFTPSPDLARVAEAIHRRGGLVSAVCHGSIGLLDLRRSDGGWLIEGRRVTGFSNLEETLIGLRQKVPFLLEDALAGRGARFARGCLPFAEHVEHDGELITGQNPRSARAVGRAVARRLAEAA